jgi:hypothetical protein
MNPTGDNLLALTRLPWHWEWVPGSARGQDLRAAWIEHMVALFEDWTREALAAVRAAWPADAGAQFPLTSDMVGRGAAAWLLERADRLPPWARLAWGAVFVDHQPRWAPVPVIVEFRRPAAQDPVYLMDRVGATGLDGDAREPVIDYVTTPAGDGVRVFALARSADGAAYGRLNAAMRLDGLPDGDRTGSGVDVLLTALVFETGLLALIGPGVEQLMQLIAAESGPQPDRGPARLRFAAAARGAKR